jgi:hypothetical protein
MSSYQNVGLLFAKGRTGIKNMIIFSSLPNSGSSNIQHKPPHKHDKGLASFLQTGVERVNLSIIYLIHCKNFLKAAMYPHPAHQ